MDDKILGFLLTWGALAFVVFAFLFWTYTKSGKKWLKNL